MTARAVVFAYHDVGTRCFATLIELGIDVPLVVTHRDDPDERVWFANVADLAISHGIDVLRPDDPNSPEMVERLRRIAPDLLFSFYYRRMLSPEVLSVARLGAFNMHGSLLPKYRGRAPVNWAVLKGETETGATLHEMTEKPDAGRIVDQEPVPIGPDDLAVDVFRRVTEAAVIVLRRSLPRILSGTAELRSQDFSQGSYFGGRKPEDGCIDWSKSATEIHNLVRAVAPPYPGAFTELSGRRMRILRTKFEPDRGGCRGSTGPYREGGAWFAECGDGRVLRLLEVEMKS